MLALAGCTPFSASTAAQTSHGTSVPRVAPAAGTTAAAGSAASSSPPAATPSAAPTTAARAVAARPSVRARGRPHAGRVGAGGGPRPRAQRRQRQSSREINAPVPDGAGGTKPCNTTGTATNAGYPEHAFTWDMALRMRTGS